MVWGKNDPAFKSGMRGGESPTDGNDGGPEPGAQPTEDVGEIVKQHVHGPDENGHHHLNLTTFAAHMHGKHGKK